MTDLRASHRAARRRNTLDRWTCAVVLLLALASPARADGFKPGELIQPFQLYDQHDILHGVDADTRVILFSRDMKGGDVLKAALVDMPRAYLQELKAVYITDISRMPGLIAKLFALPSMRRRPYPMLIDHDGNSTRAIPDIDGQATLVFLDALQVERIEHVADTTSVTKMLKGDPAPPVSSGPPDEQPGALSPEPGAPSPEPGAPLSEPGAPLSEPGAPLN